MPSSLERSGRKEGEQEENEPGSGLTNRFRICAPGSMGRLRAARGGGDSVCGALEALGRKPVQEAPRRSGQGAGQIG